MGDRTPFRPTRAIKKQRARVAPRFDAHHDRFEGEEGASPCVRCGTWTGERNHKDEAVCSRCRPIEVCDDCTVVDWDHNGPISQAAKHKEPT